MSGTSMDGVDGILVDLGNALPRVLKHTHLPFQDSLKQDLIQLNDSGKTEHELEKAALTANTLSQLYAQCVEQLTDDPSSIKAIGCHGQTIRHRPEKGFTVQLVNGALLAELTGINTICDFRSRDIAAGGQGAPLVPIVHQAWFSDKNKHRIILNLGGIANLTSLHPHQSVLGFDCGPANLLLDGWIYRSTGKSFDSAGAWARGGQINTQLLNRLLKHPFLSLPPPKSTGRESFNISWLLNIEGVNQIKAQDVQATLTEFSALCIIESVTVLKSDLPLEIVCGGGGALNLFLLERIANHLQDIPIITTEKLGMDIHQVEAAAFAWLAYAFDQGLAGNVTSVTGAKHPAILGALYPA
ncbi:MAG: anhydro-N-acetylmuramic acid kinase [Ferrovum sp. 37-45-19]|jgi:anhydro-N-acetylmuramic acid kinase|nr:MAG: anhydro-N-acetylmuramic acid kinase [Ferrovum sp. 21-44-67]OYV94303.1 MAG: anhydro-N-acetylmuramic acid kinase [Ferrovum sp. 37-45-19]OZB32396.1 MAG: anhydro-N-acetylmuramic acid kinase [Ferrovum sp. 34-44-207]